MMAPIPEHEEARLAALRMCQVLDTPPEDQYDSITRLAAHLCGTPIAAMSLVDTDRQFFKSILGLDVRETAREAAFCAHTILQNEVLIVPDSEADPRFADNPLVTGDPAIRFYAGAPLITSDGHALGSLCVIDRKPRTLTPTQVEGLSLLARQVTSQLETERSLADIKHLIAVREQTDQALRQEQAHLAALVRVQQEIATTAFDLDSVMALIVTRARQLTGAEGAAIETRDGEEMIYRVADGITAPFVGTRIPVSAPMLQAAIRTRRTQYSADCRQDWRVNQEACGKVGVHSMVVTPLQDDAEVVGMLLLHSNRLNAFTQRDYETAELLGGLLTTALSQAAATAARQSLLTERAEAMRQLQRAATLQNAVLNGAAHTIIATDAEGTITLFNAAAEQMLGYRAEEIIGKQTPVLIHDPAEVSAHARFLAAQAGETIEPGFEVFVSRCRQTGHDENEWTYLRRDGSRFPVSLSVTALRDADGVITGFLGVAKDITERRQFEQALRESEERFRSSVDAMQEGLVIQDAKGAILFCNPAAEDILGLTADQMCGRTSLDPRWGTIHEDGSDFPGSEHPAMICLRDGTTQEGSIMGIRKPDGALTWVSVNCVPLFHAEAERAFGVVVTFTDITAAKQTAEVLHRSESRLADAQRITKVGSWEYEFTTGKITFSAEMYRLMGCDPAREELDYQTCIALFHPEDAAALDIMVTRAITQGIDYELDLRRMLPVAPTQWLHAVGRVIRGPDGRLLHLAGTLADITEQREAQDRIKEYSTVLEFQRDQLAQANAELEMLATTDGLTGLKNHRTFHERLAEEAARAARYATPLSVILLDVDQFKMYNDTFGHPEGDEVLRRVGDILRRNARETDLAARYGGEEFVLLLPQTDRAGAAVIAERIRQAFETAHWPRRSVTASFGVAALSLGTVDTGSQLVFLADQALYRAKDGGRNRVVVSETVTRSQVSDAAHTALPKI